MNSVLFGNMNSGSTDASHRTCNENGLSRPRMNAHFYHLGTGEQHQRQCRCVDGVKSIRCPSEIFRLASDIFSIGVIDQTKDPITTLKVSYAFSKRYPPHLRDHGQE